MGLSNGPHTWDFLGDSVRYTDARVFHFASCSPLESFDKFGNLENASIGAVHVFATEGNAVTAVGATRVRGGNQHDDMMHTASSNKFLAKDVVAPVETAASFMDFNSSEKPWTSNNATVSYDNTVKVGETGSSLIVKGYGYKIIESPIFANTEIKNISKTILLDVWVPSEQYWFGDVQMFISIPSAGIYNEWVGQALLNETEGNWNTVKFQLNDKTFNALNGIYNDAQIVIALNTNQAADSYRLDNMRFEGTVAQPKPFNYVVTFGTAKSSAIRVDGRSVSKTNATSTMTIQKK